MKIFCIIITMVFNNILCYSQIINADICLANIVRVDNDIQKKQMNTQNIDAFLDCFIEQTNNVEILELRNEVLLKLMEHYPSDFMCSISKKNTEIYKSVCQDIERPIHDGINLYKIYYQISTIHSDSDVRLLILNSLQQAIENSEKETIK